MLGPPKLRCLGQPVTVSLERLVPANHLYRRLNTLLDLSFVRDWVKDRYADRGRPSIDPVVFFKLQLVLYLEGLRSECQLMRLAADRLSVGWYLGYGLDESLPDHSTLTRIRERLGVDAFREFFELIVQKCIDANLVWGKEVYVDATKIEANASLDSLTTRFAVDTHLRNLFSHETDDDTRGAGNGTQADTTFSTELHSDAPGDVDEQNAVRHDWIAEHGAPERDVQHHAYRRVSDFQMSTTDPDATLMRGKIGGPLRLGYHDHYVVDGGRDRIILTVLVTPSEVMENQPMLDLLWHTCFRWKLWPHQVTGDTTYGTTNNIVALHSAGILPYVPLPNWDERTRFFGPSQFTYDQATDTYHCRRNQVLRRKTAKYTEGKITYRASAATCDACSLKADCTDSLYGRTLQRSMDEDALNRVRASHKTEPYQKAMRKRQVWVEPLFAEGKLWHGMRRFRLRRLWRVNVEALLIASVQNLKRPLNSVHRGPKPVSGMASSPVTGTTGIISSG